MQDRRARVGNCPYRPLSRRARVYQIFYFLIVLISTKKVIIECGKRTLSSNSPLLSWVSLSHDSPLLLCKAFGTPAPSQAI